MLKSAHLDVLKTRSCENIGDFYTSSGHKRGAGVGGWRRGGSPWTILCAYSCLGYWAKRLISKDLSLTSCYCIHSTTCLGATAWSCGLSVDLSRRPRGGRAKRHATPGAPVASQTAHAGVLRSPKGSLELAGSALARNSTAKRWLLPQNYRHKNTGWGRSRLTVVSTWVYSCIINYSIISHMSNCNLLLPRPVF